MRRTSSPTRRPAWSTSTPRPRRCAHMSSGRCRRPCQARANLKWTPQPAMPGQLRAVTNWARTRRHRRPARQRAAVVVGAALRGDRGPQRGRRRSPLVPHPAARTVERRDERQRRRHGRRDAAAHADGRPAPTPWPPNWTRCSAPRGTRPWSPTAAAATPARSPGSTAESAKENRYGRRIFSAPGTADTSTGSGQTYSPSA